MEVTKNHSLILQGMRCNVFEVVGYVPAFGTGVYAIVVVPVMVGQEAGREISMEAMELIHGNKRKFQEFVDGVAGGLEMPMRACVLEGKGGSSIEDLIESAFRLV